MTTIVRMAEREEEPDRERLLALLHQLAHDIVDGGDVVGVEGVAQAEHIGENAVPRSAGRSANAITAQAQAAPLMAKSKR